MWGEVSYIQVDPQSNLKELFMQQILLSSILTGIATDYVSLHGGF